MATSDDAGTATRALIFALLALACGHMLSTLLRTIPAVSLDLMAADFHIEPQALASLTSIYPFAFAAAQIPVGAAMDRFGVRPVSLSLLGRKPCVGAGGVGICHGGCELCGRAVHAGGRHFGHGDVPDDAGGQAIVGSALRAVVGRDPLDRQYRHAVVVEPARLRRRRLRLARRVLDFGRLGGLRWRSAVFALVPSQPAEHKDESSPLAQMIEVLRLGLLAPLARPDRARAGVAGDIIGAARPVGRPVADGRKRPVAGRGRQSTRRIHAGDDRVGHCASA